MSRPSSSSPQGVSITATPRRDDNDTTPTVCSTLESSGVVLCTWRPVDPPSGPHPSQPVGYPRHPIRSDEKRRTDPGRGGLGLRSTKVESRLTESRRFSGPGPVPFSFYYQSVCQRQGSGRLPL